MESGKSSLNPYAASYVPLIKRGAADASNEFTSAQGYNRDEAVWSGHEPQNTVPQGQHQIAYQSYGPGFISNQNTVPQGQHQNENQGGEILASTSQYPNNIPEKSNTDEYSGMELDFLQMTFPGISRESLSGVFEANSYDLDASIDMLNQLELHPDDSSDTLPETLDIGDVPEYRSIGEQVSLKEKDVIPAGRASTSASSNLPFTD